MEGPAAAAAMPALTQALTDASWAVRHAAVVALGQIGATAHAAVPALLRLGAGLRHAEESPAAREAHSPDHAWQGEVALALAELAPEVGVAALPALVAALDDPDPAIRGEAAGWLSALGSSAWPARAALRRAAADPDPQVGGEIRMLLLGLVRCPDSGGGPGGVVRGPERPLADWLAALRDRGNRAAQVAAAGGLGQRVADATLVIPALLEAARTESAWDVRRAAVAALGELGPAAQPAVGGLLELFAAAEDSCRALLRAACPDPILGWMADDRGASAAAGAPWDAQEAEPDPAFVQYEHGQLAGDIWASLERLGPVAVAPLAAALAGGAAPVRLLAALGLVVLGPAARDALPALRAAAADPDAAVRQAAALALAELEPQPAAKRKPGRAAAPVSADRDAKAGARASGRAGDGRSKAKSATRSLEYWMEALADRDDPAIRRAAAGALAARGAEAAPAVEALGRAAWSDPDRPVQLAALRALAAIGPGAAPAVPYLVRLTLDGLRASGVWMLTGRAPGRRAGQQRAAVPSAAKGRMLGPGAVAPVAARCRPLPAGLPPCSGGKNAGRRGAKRRATGPWEQNRPCHRPPARLARTHSALRRQRVPPSSPGDVPGGKLSGPATPPITSPTN
jgi:HEAT repeat protein